MPTYPELQELQVDGSYATGQVLHVCPLQLSLHWHMQPVALLPVTDEARESPPVQFAVTVHVK